MKQNVTILFFLVVGVFLFGCQSMKTVTIEVVKPANINLPGHIQNILVLNSSIVKPKTKFSNATQQNRFNLDTAASQHLVSSVGAVLVESPKFDSVNLVKSMVFRQYNQLLKPLSWQALDKINIKFGADAIVSLEAFGIEDTIVNYSYYDGYNYTYNKSLVCIVNTLWRIYDLKNRKVIDKKIHRDTLAFDAFDTMNAYLDALASQSNCNYMANQIATQIATDVADRIAPFWLSEQRTFYTIINDEIDIATQYALNDDWINAAKIWQKYTNNKNNKIAAASCYNMALACEVQGKFDLAETWLNKSKEKYELYNTDNYLRIIHERKKEKLILDKQFGIY